MGLVNLDALGRFVETNKRNYVAYRDGLSALRGLRVIPYDDQEQNNYQYVVVEVDEGTAVTRDQLITALHAENVLARKYFWPGSHRMEPYAALYPHAELLLPNTRKVADRVLVLPTGTTVDLGLVETVISIVRLLVGTRS